MRLLSAVVAAFACLIFPFENSATAQDAESLKKDPGCVRFATFNVSFHRRKQGELALELAEPGSKNPARIAEIIQRVRPDVLLLNEFDFDDQAAGIQAFTDNYLKVSQNGQEPINYEFTFTGSVNTGVDSREDLNNDGKKGTASDAFGYGAYPGQYGMVVLSKFKIDSNTRTFKNFLWKDMPNNLLPIVPETGEPYYSEKVTKVFRLSSKSHWDVPIMIGDKTIHFLTAHPTPPVFDGVEDRNGRRNYDEIRLFADYITPGKADYIYDDMLNKGGLAEGANFVIAGDMNADEADGDSYKGAAKLLTEHPLINHDMPPVSKGGAHYAKKQGKANDSHTGDPGRDTGDFSDGKVGNLRIDYCLPSKTLTIKNSGVFWPLPDQPGASLVTATDHRLVWVDLEK